MYFGKIVRLTTYVSVSAIFLAFVLFRLNLISYYDADIGGYEYELMYEIQLLYKTGSIYSSPELPPFLITQKPPFYHFLVATIFQIFPGNGLNQSINLYFISRSLSLLLNIASSLLIFIISLQKLRFRRGDAVLVAMVTFITLSPHFYSRMDALLLPLFLGILYILFSEGIDNRQISTLAILTVTSFCVKQNGCLYAVLIIWTLYKCEEKPLRKIFSYVSKIMVLFLLMLLYQLSQATFTELVENNIYGLAVGKHLGDLFRILSSETYGLVIILSLAALYKSKSVSAKEITKLRMVLTFSICASILFLLNVGAGVNYLVEPRIVLCLFLGLLIVYTKERTKTSAMLMFYLGILFFSVARSKELYVEYKMGEYISDPITYDIQLEVAKYVKSRTDKGKYVYFIGSESFFNMFLHQEIIFPVKIVVKSLVENSPTLLDYAYYQESKNQGLIAYLIKSQKTELLDSCFGDPFHGFTKDTQIGEFEIWKYVGTRN